MAKPTSDEWAEHAYWICEYFFRPGSVDERRRVEQMQFRMRKLRELVQQHIKTEREEAAK